MSTFDLFSSVRDGNTDIVRRLLQSKPCRARLNDRNEWGDTALHLAAEAGNGEICQMLTAAGASVTVRNNRGETCLHRASVGGHVEAVRAIVGRDQDPDAVNSQNDAGYTSLHHAAKHGSKDQIDILVKAGADQMIENNAGETPYMVAHKYQQWDAERLLLNVEQQHAEKAIFEMNRKEKDIVRGFLSAVKYASHIESRVRVMLIGDDGSGKTSLKKTLSGEPYEPRERPTNGINADPSVTRVTSKQFKEWIQQPGTSSDTYRLNLEYIDIIIDYVLNFVRQPQIVSEDHLDPNALQIEKEQAKTVNFTTEDEIIPVSEDEDTDHEDLDETEAADKADEGVGGHAVVEARAVDVISGEGVVTNSKASSGILSVYDSSPRKASPKKQSVTFAEVEDTEAACAMPIVDEMDSSISYLDKEEGEHFLSAMNEEDEDFNDDRLHRLAVESESETTGDSIPEGSEPLPTRKSSSGSGKQSHPHNAGMGSNSNSMSNSGSRDQEVLPGGGGGGGGTASLEESSELQSSGKQMESSMLVFNRTRHELSRLLVEKLPLEILKRMVIRWPVGDEHYQDRSSLSANRLALTVWDTSGDPLQASFIPFLFSDQTLFVAAYSLATKLDQPCLAYANRNLLNVDGSVPSNAEVLESYLGAATAFTKRMPSEPFRCTKKTPILPPLIIACTKSDHPSLQDTPTPILFHRFFERPAFKSYGKHLVEGSSPSAVRLSSHYETQSMRSEVDLEVPYSGHHLLRREIEYLTRHLPFIRDNIPIQWVKFEQLIIGLQQQKKLIVLYADLSRYIAEHCRLSGPLQVLPVLAHFHDIGTIIHFYRHPDLSQLIITRPQWLVSVLGSIITSNPGRSTIQDVQGAYKKLGEAGSIPKEMLQLAYRCARLRQKHWNEVLFILNAMDLITCHPFLHETKSVYLPSMVVRPSPSPHVVPSNNDPLPIYFRSTEGGALPIALFNQLVVRCIRSSQYNPVLCYKMAHLRINSEHHLLLWLEHTSIVCLVQPQTDKFCRDCVESSTKLSFEPKCSSIEHLIGEDVELMNTDNLSSLISKSTNSGVDANLHLAFPDITSDEDESEHSLRTICPRSLQFVTENLQFLCNCWFPGLDLEQASKGFEDEFTVLDQFWKYTVLHEGKAEKKLSVWFSDD